MTLTFSDLLKKIPTHTSVKSSLEIIQKLHLRESKQKALPFLYIFSLDKLSTEKDHFWG